MTAHGGGGVTELYGGVGVRVSGQELHLAFEQLCDGVEERVKAERQRCTT